MIFPYIILLAIPIFFSHILFPFVEYPIEIFGYIFGETSSFERVKVILFFILVLLGILEVLLRQNKIFFDKVRKHGLLFLGVLFFPIFVFLMRNQGQSISQESWNFFLLGSHEKFHGYFFYLACVGSFFLFSFVKNKNTLIKTSLISAGIVALFALLEYAKLWEFLPVQSVSWEIGRTNSTLGNPNYVAGYLLLHLPLCFIFRSPERYIFLAFLVAAVITTGSFIAFGLMGLFLLWKGVEFFISKAQKKIFFPRSSFALFGVLSFLIVLLAFFASLSITHEKWLSFESRWVLVSDISYDLWEHPTSFFFGNGPDSIIMHYAGERSDIVDSYFPHDSSIDSVHNLWIDIIYQYGIFLFGGFLFLVWKRINILPHGERISLLLFGAFFSFNVVILAPIVPIILILSYDKNQRIHYKSQY